MTGEVERRIRRVSLSPAVGSADMRALVSDLTCIHRDPSQLSRHVDQDAFAVLPANGSRESDHRDRRSTPTVSDHICSMRICSVLTSLVVVVRVEGRSFLRRHEGFRLRCGSHLRFHQPEDRPNEAREFPGDGNDDFVLPFASSQ